MSATAPKLREYEPLMIIFNLMTSTPFRETDLATDKAQSLMMTPQKNPKKPQDRACAAKGGGGSHAITSAPSAERVCGKKQPHTKEHSLPHFNQMGQGAEDQRDNDASF